MLILQKKKELLVQNGAKDYDWCIWSKLDDRMVIIWGKF